VQSPFERTTLSAVSTRSFRFQDEQRNLVRGIAM
jgi:hypothetical protein